MQPMQPMQPVQPMQAPQPALRFWRMPPAVENAIIAGRQNANRDSVSTSSHWDLDGATVELEGRATDVRFDRETGEIVIVGPDFTVRVKSKNPR
jgi:hypothetical protein